jgi:hypothetical protein
MYSDVTAAGPSSRARRVRMWMATVKRVLARIGLVTV